jgi:phospholipase C
VSCLCNRTFLHTLSVVVFLSASIGAALGQTPTVASISPTSGAAAGGTSVTITGANFASGATVTFGSAAASNVTVVNSTTITATTPANAPGAVNVTVTNSNQQSGTLWAVQQPLTNPNFAVTPLGTGWTVNGSGTATVLTGSGAQSGSTYAQLTVASPSTQVSYIATLNGTSQYLPVNPGDVITFGGWAYRVDTNSGDGLARWQIELTNSSQQNPMYDAATPNNVTTAAWVQQQNTYTVPATGVSYLRFWCQITSNSSAKAQANFDTATLIRTVPGGGFTYVGAPSLTAVSPSSGVTTGGTAVTLTGSNFQTGATVAFGSSPATNVSVVNSTTITATTPSGSAGAVNVTVTNPGGQDSVLSNGFTYSDPAPTASSISPSTGPAGGSTAVTITGTNFLSGATVSFGGILANGVTVVNSTTITAMTPADPSGGAVNVVITNPDSQTATLWAVQQPLTNPNFASGGTGWTVAGFGTVQVLGGTGPQGTSNYAQLTVVAPNTQVSYIAQLNGTSEYLPVNPGDVISFGGYVDRVDNNSGDGLARWQIESSYNTAGPSYSVASPNNATYGAGWTLQQGSYTVPSGKNMLRFWCQITGTNGSVTAQADCGAAYFTRTVPGGGFTYTFAAPTVLSISPSAGPVGSATPTTITGTNFASGATVSFGGIAASNVSVVSSTQITATTGTTNPAGPANVVVTNPGGLSGTLANGFNFSGPAPTITYIAPVSGTTNGGTAINLHGTNFETGATVTIGGAPLNITFVGSTLIQGTTTAHVAGGADVVVTNADTQVATLSSTLYNYGFETGTTDWTFLGTGTATVVDCSSSGCGTTNNAHNGTYYVELNAPVSGNHPSYMVANSGGTARYFPVQPGQVITFGGWAYRVSGNGSARWTIAVSNASKAGTIYYAATPGNIWDSQWELQQGTYTVPAGMAYVQLYCEINAPTQASVARFDDAFLQIAPGTATSPVIYTAGYEYNSPPWLNSVSPNWGAPAGGTTRTAWGTGFQTGSTVTVGGVAATNVVVNNANAITFFVPANSAGSENVVVTGPDLQPSTQTVAYNYQVPPNPPAGWTAIHHIIYTLQENRSFDQYFGQMNNYYTNIGVSLPSVNVPPPGTQLKDIAGVEIAPFHSQTECVENTQPSWNAQHVDYDNGAMDDFLLTGNMFSTSSTIDPNGTRAIGYFDWTDLPFYYSLAYQFATSDTWYSSVMANTGANRSFVVAGTSLGSVGTPTAPSAGLPNMTIFDLLDQAGITWRYYYQDSTPIWIPIWSIYNKNVGPSGFNANIVPISNYATDVQDEATFPQVVFLEENGSMDEHPKPNPGASGATGSIQLGASLTSGFIGDLLKSPSWSSSVLIFTYDEAGGVYDHVAPPANQAIPDGYPPQVTPGTDQPGLFNQFGMRVPLMVVSPWTTQHYVSHVTHDHTSILKFIETRFSLPPLTARDAAADDMADFFGTNGANLTNGTTPWLTPPSISPTCNPGTTACLVTQPTTGACNLNLEAAP